ncbi:hypothetical protein EPUS_08044 [Endocarpon pusillum Z07020]|uniref:PD-(D/E)XK nuclease-like domain-containing protein n=1 Tax=Endocarpon pusillum (strain Z07020 / HMAS-L-300199) TaxID=1263415 RepID=U1HZK7_ENDPU|nr:uncharacterized protein EPUS_08044 [Endocarpon pusillum Z07020]ERF74999.1 hypothetical protein EPUS_08044 [Endocarpon pusillum Z07020]
MSSHDQNHIPFEGPRRRGRGRGAVLEHRAASTGGLDVNAHLNTDENDGLDLGLEDVNLTPHPKKRRYATGTAIATSDDAASDHSSRSSLSLPPSLSGADSPIKGSRSSSPIKHLLRVAMRKDEPIHVREYNPGQSVSDEFPHALADMWATLRKCSRRAVIPSTLEGDIRRHFPSDADLLDARDFLDAPSKLTMEHLNDLLRGAHKSFMKTEPHWNCASHFPALDRAVQTAKIVNCDDVSIENITLADILPQYNLRDETMAPYNPSSAISLPSAATTTTPSSRVDLALTIGLTAAENEILSNHNITHINHTAFDSLTRSPIAVSVEAKRSGEGKDKSQYQLAVWVSAQFRRLEELFGREKVQQLAWLPLLRVQGEHWHFLAAVRVGRSGPSGGMQTVIWSEISLGSMREVLGVFHVLAALHVLVEWADTTFRQWFAGCIQALGVGDLEQQTGG